MLPCKISISSSSENPRAWIAARVFPMSMAGKSEPKTRCSAPISCITQRNPSHRGVPWKAPMVPDMSMYRF